MPDVTREPAGTLHQVIAEVLEVPWSVITDASSREQFTRWDSLGSILLMTSLEQRFRVRFTLAELMTIRTVADIKAALARHGVGVDE
jgi:acyl carrier protein